jgi:hypothetical protein
MDEGCWWGAGSRHSVVTYGRTLRSAFLSCRQVALHLNNHACIIHLTSSRLASRFHPTCFLATSFCVWPHSPSDCSATRKLLQQAPRPNPRLAGIRSNFWLMLLRIPTNHSSVTGIVWVGRRVRHRCETRFVCPVRHGKWPPTCDFGT